MAKDRRPQILWTDQPPATAHKNFDLIRTPKNGAQIKLTIISHSIHGTPTHWFGGRTIGCTRPTCPACEAGTPQDWHAYFAAIEKTTDQIVLFEVTPAAADFLHKSFCELRTLRGLQVSLWRRDKKLNSGICIRAHGISELKEILPAAPNVMKEMAKIWRIQLPTADDCNGQAQASQSEAHQEQATNGIRGRIRTLGTDGLELPGGRSRLHDVHVEPQEARGVQQEPAPLRTEPNPSSHAKSVLNNFLAMEEPHSNGAPEL